MREIHMVSEHGSADTISQVKRNRILQLYDVSASKEKLSALLVIRMCWCYTPMPSSRPPDAPIHFT